MTQFPLTTYSLDELVARARAGSPFFREMYAQVPEHPKLTDLPVLDLGAFWRAQQADNRSILTGPPSGILLNSGGSTGAPKLSYVNDEEWDSSVALSVRAFEGTGIRDGDRVANLFASGYLSASFLLATESLKALGRRILQFPIGYFAPVPDAARIIRAYRINVLAGFPTHLLSLFHFMEKEGIDDVRVERVLFAGEIFTAEQRAYIESRSPGVQIRSVGYASVDAGTMGYADATCGPGEHRVYDGATYLEILDEETDDPIEEQGVAGRIVFTNLTRTLMPLLRYPSGDRGRWVEPPGTPARKFMLLGRAGESARVASFNVHVTEVSDALEPFRERLGIRQFQLMVTQENLRDRLTLRLAGQGTPEALAAAEPEIVEGLLRQKLVLGEMVRKGMVSPVVVEWIRPEQLTVNPRTGKTRMVIDDRAG